MQPSFKKYEQPHVFQMINVNKCAGARCHVKWYETSILKSTNVDPRKTRDNKAKFVKKICEEIHKFSSFYQLKSELHFEIPAIAFSLTRYFFNHFRTSEVHFLKKQDSWNSQRSHKNLASAQTTFSYAKFYVLSENLGPRSWFCFFEEIWLVKSGSNHHPPCGWLGLKGLRCNFKS